ncbi:MAG: hypothetical protein K0S04_1142 [Herbinix sp.]|nr:hypothetical protein [Herbinix sp.]
MKSKLCFGIAIFICIMSAVIITYNMEQSPDTDQVKASWKGYKNIEALVIAENEQAKEAEDSSEAASDKIPDYTKMFPDLYTEYAMPKPADKDKKIAYLSFDDGPSENTYKVLDILQEYDATATFFIVGSAIDKKSEDSLLRMVNEGHTIGIHTYSHMCNEIYCSIERYLDDFNLVYEQIYDITGKRVNLYRFPWGSNNSYGKHMKDSLIDEMERRGFTCYDWNVDSQDSNGRPSASTILRNIKKDIKRQNQPIILMHDSKINNTTVKLLPEIIEMIQEMGYEFDTLDHREPYQFPW